MKRFFKYLVLSLIGIAGVSICIFLYEAKTFVTQNLSGDEIKGERFSIHVPENRNVPNSNKIKVKFVRLKSFSKSPQAPIFYLAGGPGDRCRRQVENPSWMEKWTPYLKDRDVILIDQRGVGNLKMWWFNLKTIPSEIFSDQTIAENYIQEIATKSKKVFDARGIDLNGYNTLENAKDIDAVRAYFGYEQIVPLGFSYGTHLGLCYLKEFESKVDKMILIGVEGLDQTYKKPLDLDQHLEIIESYMRQDSTFEYAIPDLRALYKRVSDKLDKNPINFEIKTPLLLKRKVKLGSFGLNYIFKRDLGDRNDIPKLVKLLFLIDQDRPEQIRFYLEKRYKEFMAVPAMHLAMDLSSGGSDERKAIVAAQTKESLFDNINNFPHYVVDRVWDIQRLNHTFRRAPVSTVPMLLCSGSLDINTPAYQAEMIKEQNENATHIVVGGAGHEQIFFHRNMDETIFQFLEGKDVSNVNLNYPPLKF